ncbi:MAG: MGMT family protein [Myxococcota bacterium]
MTLDVFRAAVYEVTRLIPRGRVASYGQVATYVVSPRHARAIGTALRELPPELVHEVPWQRVINAQGRISFRGDVKRPVEQERLLAKEGIEFSEAGVVDWRRFRWKGPGEDFIPVLLRDGWTPD